MGISRRRMIVSTGSIGLLASGCTLKADQKPASAGHVALLGDSIFDNKAYVGEKPAVIDQVKESLGAGWDATLLAIDGDVATGVKQQLARLPSSVTHLIVSVGGNDALRSQDILVDPVRICGEALLKFAQVQEEFGRQYAQMLELVLSHRKPTAVCTIYDPNFDDSTRQAVSVAALSLFNDRISRFAFSEGIPVIDLRLLFSGKADYANPIEPSPEGGKKIAEEICRIVKKHDFSKTRSVLYCGK